MLAYMLTFGRLLLAAGIAVVVWSLGSNALSISSAGVLLALVAAMELTDLFDGIAARRSGSASILGGILDPLVDSLSRCGIFFAFAFTGWISMAVPLVMAGRDIIVAYTRVVQAMAAPQAGEKTSARLSGKLKAIVQGLAAVAVVMLAWGRPAMAEHSVQLTTAGISAGVIGVTVWSLIDYVRGAWASSVLLARRRGQ